MLSMDSGMIHTIFIKKNFFGDPIYYPVQLLNLPLSFSSS